MPTNNNELIKKYLDKYPGKPSRTIARFIHSDHPHLYSVESARSTVRHLRGTNGKEHRKHTRNTGETQYFDQAVVIPDFLETEIPLNERKPYQMVYDGSPYLFLYDLHIPYCDKKALEIAIDYGRQKEIKTIILGGDYYDFHGLGWFTRHPSKARVKEELSIGQELFDYLEDIFPNATILYLEGNHDYRYEKYLLTNAPELYDVECFKFEEFAGLKERNIKYLRKHYVLKVGKLHVIHGHEYRMSPWFSYKNIGSIMYDRTKSNCISGHLHRTNEYEDTTLAGDLLVNYIVGCLCDLYPEYAPKPFNKWNHGYAGAQVDREGNFDVENKKILF